MHRWDNRGIERDGEIQIPLFQGHVTVDGPETDERDMQEGRSDSPLTQDVQFLPGRGQMRGKGDVVLVRAERNTRTHTQILLQQTTLETYFNT